MYENNTTNEARLKAAQDVNDAIAWDEDDLEAVDDGLGNQNFLINIACIY